MYVRNDTNLQKYSYNQSTNKLSLQDGTKDSFCRFFNGEELLEDDIILKADAQKKSAINHAIEDIKSDDIYGLTSKDVWDLQYESFDPFRDCVWIDDRFCAQANYCLGNPNEFTIMSELLGADYSYCDDIKYSKEENGISLVPGKRLQLNGWNIEIKKNHVKITDTEGKDITRDEGYAISDLMDKLIRCANDQIPVSNICSYNIEVDILQVILDLGINMKENFIINGREFMIKENKIFAVDDINNPLSFLGLTKRQLDMAIQKYENNLFSPIS